MKTSKLLSLVFAAVVFVTLTGCSTMKNEQSRQFVEGVEPPAAMILACRSVDERLYFIPVNAQQEVEYFKLAYSSAQKRVEECRQAVFEYTATKAQAPKFSLHPVHSSPRK